MISCNRCSRSNEARTGRPPEEVPFPERKPAEGVVAEGSSVVASVSVYGMGVVEK